MCPVCSVTYLPGCFVDERQWETLAGQVQAVTDEAGNDSAKNAPRVRVTSR
jgi:hypothetical protein